LKERKEYTPRGKRGKTVRHGGKGTSFNTQKRRKGGKVLGKERSLYHQADAALGIGEKR